MRWKYVYIPKLLWLHRWSFASRVRETGGGGGGCHPSVFLCVFPLAIQNKNLMGALSIDSRYTKFRLIGDNVRILTIHSWFLLLLLFYNKKIFAVCALLHTSHGWQSTIQGLLSNTPLCPSGRPTWPSGWSLFARIDTESWASREIRKFWVAHVLGIPGTFSLPLPVSDPDMHHGTCVTHVPWCIPGSLTSGFLWSLWRGKRPRHSRCMCYPQFYVSGKRPMNLRNIFIKFSNILDKTPCFTYFMPKHLITVDRFRNVDIF